MAELYFDPPMTDMERREALYDGAIFVYRPSVLVRDFCTFADGLIKEAIGSLDPETSQYELPSDRCIDILQQLKPHVIHHPEPQ